MTTNTDYHIVFAGGGTGGHLFPGIAVAEQLTRDLPGARITFAGSGRGFEQRHVREAGFHYLALRSCPLPRRPWRIGSFLIENLHGYRTARRFLDRHDVAVVVGLGGFVSAAMARAAVKRHVPLVLLEQNVIPGRTTRWLAKWATFLCASMEETIAHLDQRCPVLVTGNPLRTPFLRSPHNSPRPLATHGLSAPHDSPRPLTGEGQGVRAVNRTTTPKPSPLHQAPDSLRSAPRTNSPSQELLQSLLVTEQQPSRKLLILGGSGGARSLNENVPLALARTAWALRGWQIVHQTGQGNVEATRQLYQTLELEAVVVPFVSDMAATLSQTDLAICRAGGTTLAELAAMGVPAVLLPYPHAADDHQLKNAQRFAASEGCIVVDERRHPDDLADFLADALGSLLSDEGQCEAMSHAIHTLARPEAARDVATLIGQLVSNQ